MLWVVLQLYLSVKRVFLETFHQFFMGRKGVNEQIQIPTATSRYLTTSTGCFAVATLSGTAIIETHLLSSVALHLLVGVICLDSYKGRCDICFSLNQVLVFPLASIFNGLFWKLIIIYTDLRHKFVLLNKDPCIFSIFICLSHHIKWIKFTFEHFCNV